LKVKKAYERLDALQSCNYYIGDVFRVVSNQLEKGDSFLKEEVMLWKLESTITRMKLSHTTFETQVRKSSNKQLHSTTLRWLRARDHKEILTEAFS
jgi:hypothetical protein